ncbi:MAG: RNA-binding protein [Armatimonadota bacterium]|nr:MAG: RNA-binding protein [Armatimonadota bacterium]
MPGHAFTVYVGNLPWQATEDDLAALFAEFGPIVNVRIIQDPVTGRSRGYGFVELASREDVPRAVASVDGRELNGRILVVSHARPRPSRH